MEYGLYIYIYIYAKERLEALKDVNQLSDSMLHKIAHDKTDPRNKQAIQILYKKAGKSMENGDKKKAMQYLDKVTYRPKSMDLATLTDKYHEARNKFLETRDYKYKKLADKIAQQIKKNS